jgi:hypothetical protein
MASTDSIYQSILHKLSEIPVDYLNQIDSYLETFAQKTKVRQNNRTQILDLAGSWNDMDEDTFQEYLLSAKKTEIFSREVSL